jgi:DNA-binding NarL/FixJ family response regulator
MSSPTASLGVQGSAKIRVLIADDHAVVREGLVAILNRQDDLTVVGEAANGREALEQWRKHRPDITLMDLRMPEMSGIAAIDAIHAEDDQALIIILTTYDSDEDVYRAMRAGAKAYVLKDAHREELLADLPDLYSFKSLKYKEKCTFHLNYVGDWSKLLYTFVVTELPTG